MSREPTIEDARLLLITNFIESAGEPWNWPPVNCLAGHCDGSDACRELRQMSETTLYPTIKRFLEAAGFRVKGEVEGSDVVAVRDSTPLQLAVVEMKLGFTLELPLQAVDRTRAADDVWLAVPATRRGRDRDRRVHRLCRMIGFGLMAVNVARDRI